MRRTSVSLTCLGWLIVFVVAAPAAFAAPLLTVDTFEDTFDGSCADGDCSLRDAIVAVDDGGTIRVPSGFYPLSLSGPGGPEAGDLDLARPVTIVGVGETGSFLDASALGDRVFDVRADVAVRALALLGGSQVGTGGVVRAMTGTLDLTRTTIFGGRAKDGGAVAVGDGATASIVRSWISSSRATGRGGALYVRGATLVTRSTISGNHATGGGGAFVALSVSLSIDDSALSRNVAVRGGGIRANGDVHFFSSTIARNEADVGGGLLMASSSGSSASNSVFEGNQASIRAPLCVRQLSSHGHNVADAKGCGLTAPTDLAGVDPRIGILRQNGGPTPSHALKIGSPAVGRGAGCNDTDQRGAPRSDCDSGSYELVFCLGRPVTIVGTPGDDEFSGGLGRDVFLGLGGDDEFQGSLDDDRACSGNGDDHLIGGPGDDQLAGRAGRDILRGEDGDDLLIGGLGADICRGGAGQDITRRCETVS
ncbi:MAG TPA: choice-of-anchor Q domain-containing protein [Actinomycetota bacterium]|nr:choice-of-anchor Q domain-containing protein [Actinomycetota bacterium]